MLTGNNNYGKNDGAGGVSGASYYLSETAVNGGELRVNGQTGTNSGTGGSIVRVNISGKLSGNGRIIPAQMLEADNLVTVASGGTLSPGAGVLGILTIGSVEEVEAAAGDEFVVARAGEAQTGASPTECCATAIPCTRASASSRRSPGRPTPRASPTARMKALRWWRSRRPHKSANLPAAHVTV